MATEFRTLAAAIKTALDTISGLSLSPNVVNARATPNTLLDRVYSLDMQQQNTGQYRDRDYQRLRATVTVAMLHRINPHDQWTSLLAALDDEELVIEKLMDQTQLPSEATEYVRTRRTVLAGGTHRLTEIQFEIDHDHTLE